MGVKPKHTAYLLVLVGAALVCAGVALVYLPAAIVLAGVCLTAIGLVGIDVEPRKRR